MTAELRTDAGGRPVLHLDLTGDCKKHYAIPHQQNYKKLRSLYMTPMAAVVFTGRNARDLSSKADRGLIDTHRFDGQRLYLITDVEKLVRN